MPSVINLNRLSVELCNFKNILRTSDFIEKLDDRSYLIVLLLTKSALFSMALVAAEV